MPSWQLKTCYLKHLGPRAMDYMTKLFNLSASGAVFPAIWKAAVIVPIFKPGKPADQGSSYRPVSLLSPVAKVLERLLLMSTMPKSPFNICVGKLAFLLLSLLVINNENSGYASSNNHTSLLKFDLKTNLTTIRPFIPSPSKHLYFFNGGKNILRCGDILSQPGPTTSGVKQRKVTNPCSACRRGVTRASKAVSCDSCDIWTHVRCIPCISLSRYHKCAENGETIPFTCDYCCLAQLPFAGEDDIDDTPGQATAAAGARAAPAGSAPQVSLSSSYDIPRTLTLKGINLIHANVRSLLPKLPEVRLFLSWTKATIFAASETWLDSSVNDVEVSIPGFHVIRCDRNRNGGGVAIYIRDSIAFNPRPDLAVDGLEATWVELLLPKTKGILICACYRPPTDQSFLSKLEESLSKVNPGSEFYVLGDMNINIDTYVRNGTSPLKSDYNDILELFDCTHLVTEATRVTQTSSSSIDHIFTNMKDKVRGSGVINCGFSDHLITYCSRGVVKNSIPKEHIVRRIRCFGNYNSVKLNDELRSSNWSNILDSSDVNNCLSEFANLFRAAVDKVAPKRDVRVKQKSEPWISSHIISGIKERDRLLGKFKKDRNNVSLYRDYCRMRNLVQRDIKLAKRNFFQNKVEQNRGDSGKLWDHLKSLGYSDKCSGGKNSNIVLEENGVKVFDSGKVAGIFNTFYTSVASNLVNCLPSPSGIFNVSADAFRRFYLGKTRGSNFCLSPVSRHFVRRQLQGLNPKKANGLDDISSRFLRDGAESIIEPVTHIINLSIITETVPSEFKKAKVIPLFKKGSKLDASNYRPVSLLNVLSKVLERAVHTQLNEFLEKKDLLFHNQSGFRGKHSTDTCLIGLTDFIKGEIGRGNLIGMVIIDLQKAFDTVNHELLLQKMRAIGITSVAWFKSYLSDREQCVEIDGTRSSFKKIECGVPQGSILGPQLFLLYVNDMQMSIGCKLLLYADDSALIFSHNDSETIARRLSDELSNCKRWLVDNKLSLHVEKTESILFGTIRKLKKVRNFQIWCDGVAVKKVGFVKYLGVLLDENMSAKLQAQNVIKTCVGRLSFLYRNSGLLDVNCRKILCSALIQPYIDYCCSSWYSSLTKLLQGKLDVLQRRMVRFTLFKDNREHIDTEHLAQLSWLSIPDRVAFFKLLHVFKIKNGMAPSYLLPQFTPLNLAHSHNTRGSVSNFAVSKSVSISTKTFCYSGILLWNALPSSFKVVENVALFKAQLRDHFLSKY
jgi:retron-type reverse transcriptase